MAAASPVASTPMRPPPGILRASENMNVTNITPVRRKRVSMAPHTPIPESPAPMQNDDAERLERRRSVLMQRTLNRLPGEAGSPAIASPVVLSDQDVRAQLQICSKLHAENKINIKNVWTLKIIDALKQWVKKDDPEVLKVAGNSLEIAGKVYGLRVDDLHAEGLKLASNLARTFDKKSRDDDENDENIDPNAPPDEQQQKKKRQKKKRLLEGDKKLTVNHETKSWKATLPKLESAAFSAKTDTTLSAVSNLCTVKVRMDSAGHKFMFLSKERAWAWTPKSDPSVKPELEKLVLNLKPVANFVICAPFKDFEVDNWDPDQEKAELARISQTSQNLEEVVFDDNGVPIPELDGSIVDVFQERDDNDDFRDDDDPVEEEIALPQIREGIENIVDFRPTENVFSSTALERSDYSYNTVISTCAGKIDQIWAGPSHWKLKFLRRSTPVYSGQDRQKEQDKAKKRGARKKAEPEPLDFRNLKPVELCMDKKVVKKKNHIADESKITLPLFNPACRRLIERIEELITVPSLKPTKKREQNVECEVNEYKYDNPDDSNYCPQQVIGETDNGGNDDNFDPDDDISPMSQDECGFGEAAAVPFTKENLVDAPEMVPQSYMHYATKAKRMDMKQLKAAVWITLTQAKEFNLSSPVIPTTFADMYRKLPEKITEKMNQELSCPIAFVALLHLCNEQNLALKKGLDITNFEIFGPS